MFVYTTSDIYLKPLAYIWNFQYKECILFMTNDKQLCCKFEYLAV
jgi:hypothetical protein